MDVLSEYKASISEAIANCSEEDAITQNLPLVVFLANRFHASYPALELEDLVGCGNIGLLKAVRNFDNGRDIKFSTYASTVIYREFLKCMVDSQNRGCRIPRKTFEQVQIVVAYVSEHGQIPQLEDLEPLLPRKTPLPVYRYLEIMNAYQSYIPYAGEIKEDLIEAPEETEDVGMASESGDRPGEEVR